MSYKIIYGDPPDNLQLNRLGIDYSKSLAVLYKDAFSLDIDVSKQKKWFYDNPIEPVKEVFLVGGKKLIGYNYFHPRTMSQGVNAGLVGGAMMHTDYRGEYIFFIREVMNSLVQSTPILYCFCNEKSYPIFTSKLMGFYNIPQFKQYIVDCAKEDNTTPNTTKFKSIGKVSVKAEQMATFKRSFHWIQWRTLSRSHEYQFAGDSNGHVFIFKKFNDNIDLLSILNCDSIDEYSFALKCFIDFVKSKNMGEKVFLFSSDKTLNMFIENKFNYHELNYKRYLCFRTNIEEIAPTEPFVELIDSDTF